MGSMFTGVVLEVVREVGPVGVALLEERFFAFHGFVRHVGKAGGFSGEDLLPGESVVGQVESELEHSDGLR
jgi:hypothetical protein